MPKSLLYKFFGLGKMPEKIKQTLINDQLIYLEEGVSFSIKYTDYQAPGRRFYHKKSWWVAALGFSNNFFVVSTQRKILINMAIKDKKFSQLKFYQDQATLLIKFNSAVFNNTTSGEIELRFRVENINPFLKFIKNYNTRNC
ncbi:MAG: hypothetical protein WCW27_01190 [Patescibacteria group bacterium]|jgi:hypothetical protein